MIGKTIVEILEWTRSQGITLPCKPKSKAPMDSISSRTINGPDGERDSFHDATKKRLEQINAWWSAKDYLREATEKDISASIDMNAGYNSGHRICCIDVDTDRLYNAIMNNAFFQACPAVVGKKGVKLFFKIEEDCDQIEEIMQFYNGDAQTPSLEVFTIKKHALIYGEHPDSTEENPIFYHFVRGFGDPFPTIPWSGARTEILAFAQKAGIAAKTHAAPAQQKKTTKPKQTPNQSNKNITDALDLRIEDLGMPTGDTAVIGSTVKGTHPAHGSTTGNNYEIDTTKNTWFCHRCNAGGGPLEILAVIEGIKDCSDFGRGIGGKVTYTSEEWGKLFAALEARGYTIPKVTKGKKAKKNDTKEDAPEEFVPKPLTDDPELAAEIERCADEILAKEHGTMDFMLKTFHRGHIGDGLIAESLIMSQVSQVLENTRGVQVFVSGESGKGKSHAVEQLLKQVPEEFKLKGSFSDKALFYSHEIREGMIIWYDDKAMSEDMAATFKNATSNFSEAIQHHTLNQNREGVVVEIPARCVWWVANVEGPGDDQVLNRVLKPWIDDSEEQDRLVQQYMCQAEARSREIVKKEQKANLICRAIWRKIRAKMHYVRIPYAPYIRFQGSRNRRNNGMLLDLIKCNAILNFPNRKCDTDKDGVVLMDASEEDFKYATDLWARLDNETGGQSTNMTKKESAVIEVITKMKWREFDISDIQEAMHVSYDAARRYMMGRKDRENTGVLSTCPAIKVKSVSESETSIDINEKKQTTHRQIFVFDPDVYRDWAGIGGVWLDVDAWTKDENYNDNDDDDDFPETRSETPAPAERDDDVAVEPATVAETVVEKPAPTARADAAPAATAKAMDDECFPDEAFGAPKFVGTATPTRPQSPPRQTTAIEVGSFAVEHRDYIAMFPPEPKKACQCCGETKGWFYIEDVDANPKHICRSCYNKAKDKFDMKAQTPIPGQVDVNAFEQISADIGICERCGERRATYAATDGSGIFLCEKCLGREMAHSLRERGIV